jgi:hypothetical protein
MQAALICRNCNPIVVGLQADPGPEVRTRPGDGRLFMTIMPALLRLVASARFEIARQPSSPHHSTNCAINRSRD